MKLLFEILLSILLHPIAMILMWINLLGRGDLTGFQKVVWFIVSIVWGLGTDSLHPRLRRRALVSRAPDSPA